MQQPPFPILSTLSDPCSHFLLTNTRTHLFTRWNEALHGIARDGLATSFPQVPMLQTYTPNAIPARAFYHHGLLHQCAERHGISRLRTASHNRHCYVQICGIGATYNKTLFSALGEMTSRHTHTCTYMHKHNTHTHTYTHTHRHGGPWQEQRPRR